MLAKLSRADMMEPMPLRKSGAPTRRAILLALLEQEPRTVSALAEVAGISQQGMDKHVRRLEDKGWLKVKRRMGQHGSEVTLTEEGRDFARTV